MDHSSTDGNVRKRVCKACDRCRLKKSKCDGASPCSRCKADNAICVFGERKKAHDKVYPKGYVEMLEQQQSQLVAGLRELYRRLQTGEGWPGAPLREGQGGHPLTHDILERLDLLHGTTEGGTHYDGFEEDCQKMQRKLLENGAGFHNRRGSVSSDSEHGHLSSPSSYGTPSSARLSIDSSRNMTPPTPPMNSPFPGQAQLNTSASIKASSQLAIPSYVRPSVTPAQWIQSPFTTDVPMMDDLPSLAFSTGFDAQMNFDQSALSFEHQLSAQPATMNPSMAMTDWTDASELDFSTFIDPIST